MNGLRSKKKLRLLPWLEDKLNSGIIPGLAWQNREERIFGIKWKRMDNSGEPEQDSAVFKEWEIYKDRYKEGGEPEWQKWKHNFRCSLNKLTRNNQLRNLTESDSLRVYQIVDKGVKRCLSGEEKSNLSISGPSPRFNTPDFGSLIPGLNITTVDDNEIETGQKVCLDEGLKLLDLSNLVAPEYDAAICTQNYSIGSGSCSIAVSMETESLKDAESKQSFTINPVLNFDFLEVVDNYNMNLTLRWGSEVIEERRVSNCHGCRVFYGDSLSFPEWSDQVFGPIDAEQINITYCPSPQDPGYEKRRQLLQALELGVSLFVENGCIYLTRRCKARAYIKNGERQSFKIGRMEKMKVFDLAGVFMPAVQLYQLKQGPRPCPYVILALGRDFCYDTVDTYADLHLSITVSVPEAPLLLNFPVSPTVDLSNSNEYDQFLEAFKNHVSIGSSVQQQ